jgi:hypothetical protein
MNRSWLFYILLIFTSANSQKLIGQSDSLIRCITLDNFSIVASSEFNINKFIARVKEDTSFYQAFKNYNYYNHTTTGHISVLNRKELIKASETIHTSQKTLPQKGFSKLKWQNQKIQQTEGKMRDRKGNFKFTTAEMYYETFFIEDTVSVSNQITSVNDEYVGNSKASQHKHDLKVVMFNPGSDVKGIPIIGKKMSIFDDDMVLYYDYSISKRLFNGSYCYVFSCLAKEKYREDKTVIKYLITYFDAETMLVLKREYKMKYSSLLFQFDVDIKVENQLKNEVIIPKSIIYDGEWDIPFKSSEKFHFDLLIVS